MTQYKYSNPLYFILFLLLLPALALYFVFCFTIPLIKINKIKNQKGIKFWTIKDKIHADYLFESIHFIDTFPTDKKYISVGWGDRKIFLETKSWGELRIEDFIKAFFGLNGTVLRVDYFDELPPNKQIKEFEVENLDDIKKHIKKSHTNNLIKKQENFYQIGDYYESKLQYNCIMTCNNWINIGLRKSFCSNRIWCPISYWL